MDFLNKFDLNISFERWWTFKNAENLTFKNQFFVKFDEAAKLGKATEDAYNQEDWLIFKDILNEWVSKGLASDPHDFTK